MNSLFSISKTEVRFRKKKILIAKTIISPLAGTECNLKTYIKKITCVLMQSNPVKTKLVYTIPRMKSQILCGTNLFLTVNRKLILPG